MATLNNVNFADVQFLIFVSIQSTTGTKMAREVSLSPSKIRFMHNRINSKFSDQRSLNETVENIENGLMDVYDLPLIRVVRKDGYYYAFDNRRLYVYRVLHHRGVLDEIRVKLAPLSKFQPSRFSTTNNGESVELARGITLQHSEATSPPSSPETFSDVDDEDDYENLINGLHWLDMDDDENYSCEDEDREYYDYNLYEVDSDDDYIF